MGSSSFSSLSTSTYRCYDSDPEVVWAARILMSLSSSSSSSKNFYPVPYWTKFKKRSSHCNRSVEESRKESIPFRSDDNRLIDEVMAVFNDELVLGRSVDTALNNLKLRYNSSKEIVAGVKSFEFLLSEGLDRDQMLKVLDAVCEVNGVNMKIDSELEQLKRNSDLLLNIKKSPMKIKVKMKMKMECVSEFAGEDDDDDDLRGNTRSYECNECREVFASFQALGGHTASHNRKRKMEELNQTSSDATEIKSAAGFGRGGQELVYKCNLCPKSFPTGQALGGHKTCHKTSHREPVAVERKESSGEQVGKIQDFDLNMVAPEYENYELVSSPEFENSNFCQRKI